MAFVCQNDRGIVKLPIGNQLVGPGSYEVDAKNQRTAFGYAPFNSTALRTTIGVKKQLPGPGDYSIKQQLGQPTLTTYSNSTSIIIKVNSAGTNPFLSKQARFSANQSPRPGPGQYCLEKRKMNKKRKSLPPRKLIVQPHKNQPSISAPKTMLLNQRRVRTQQAIKQLKQQLSKNLNSLGSVWARDKVNRFKSNCNNQVGPNQYNLSRSLQSKSKNQMPAFASKTVKSFFDTITFKTESNQIMEIRKKQGFKRQSPAPGFYQLQGQIQNKTEQYKVNSFGSTIQRFKQTSFQQQQKIPFYDVTLRPHKSSNKKKTPFGSQVKRCLTSESDSQLPGPGYYNPDEFQIGKIMKIQFGKFGSNVKRQLYSPKQGEIGPGCYEYSRVKTQEPKQSSVFRSLVPKQNTTEKTDQTFGVYDTSCNDIGRKALESRNLRMNLKRISYDKPGFDTQQARFRHYQFADQPQQITLRQRQLQYLAMRKEQKNKAISILRQQIPSKISTVGKSRRFDEPKNMPGVGDYSIRNKWVKKSYNIKYTHDVD